jgi:hypothetical protein
VRVSWSAEELSASQKGFNTLHKFLGMNTNVVAFAKWRLRHIKFDVKNAIHSFEFPVNRRSSRRLDIEIREGKSLLVRPRSRWLHNGRKHEKGIILRKSTELNSFRVVFLAAVGITGVESSGSIAILSAITYFRLYIFDSLHFQTDSRHTVTFTQIGK